MAFKPVQKLQVLRTLTTGKRVAVGVLAQNRQGVFFQYDAAYLSEYGNLSPFGLIETLNLQPAPKTPHGGLHGVFADCLPDGWGLLLQDRLFRQQGISPSQVTQMDRLALVGKRAIGALSFEPATDWICEQADDIDLATLGLQAQAVFDGQTDDVLMALLATGSSGGAGPKAQVYLSATQPQQCRTYALPGDQAWLVKFTSQNLALGHEESLCEAVYLQMAERCGLQPPRWRLFDAPQASGARAWLGVQRFDWIDHGRDKPAGRLHQHSACGLLDADFRVPSLDYSDLIKASRQLCKSPRVGQLQFKRAVFNLLACNQDDHSKNWAFLQDDQGQWQPAPFYDVTFSPHPFNEHATAFGGYGKQPPLKTIQDLAFQAGFANWKQAQQAIAEIVDNLANFKNLAQDLDIQPTTINAIERILSQGREQNKALLR